VKENIACFPPYVNFREKTHEDKGCTKCYGRGKEEVVPEINRVNMIRYIACIDESASRIFMMLLKKH
jgi:protein-arginine kinase activator protein McsA